VEVSAPLTVRLIARRRGPFKRWWIACPRRTRLRDARYLPRGGCRFLSPDHSHILTDKPTKPWPRRRGRRRA